MRSSIESAAVPQCFVPVWLSHSSGLGFLVCKMGTNPSSSIFPALNCWKVESIGKHEAICLWLPVCPHINRHSKMSISRQPD